MSATPKSSKPTVEAIEQAFKAVWNLYEHRARHDQETQEVMVILSRTLVALAADGITDAKELRRRAVENMGLGPR